MRSVYFDRLAGQRCAADYPDCSFVAQELEIVPCEPACGKSDSDAVVLEVIVVRAFGVLDEEFHAVVFPYGAVGLGADCPDTIFLYIETDQQGAFGMCHPGLYFGLEGKLLRPGNAIDCDCRESVKFIKTADFGNDGYLLHDVRCLVSSTNIHYLHF